MTPSTHKAIIAATVAIVAAGSAIVATTVALTSSSPTRTVTLPAPITHTAVTCPVGQSFAGCSLPKTFRLAPRTIPAGCDLPDVSSFQGSVNWPAVIAWQHSRGCPAAGIFKLGEVVQDPFAAHNASELEQLHAWFAAYWFVRNTGCSHEAAQIAADARALHVHVIELDLEVPEAAGYGLCLTPPLKRAGLIVGEYTSPGSNPGGMDEADPLWEATFGPSFTAIWHPVVAWQFSDNAIVPGISTPVDLSVNLGITSQGTNPQPKPKPKPKPRTVCFGHGYNPRHHAKVCNTIRPLTSKRSRARDTSEAVDKWITGVVTGYRCRKPYRRAVCINGEHLKTTMDHRVRYFTRLVQAALKQYG